MHLAKGILAPVITEEAMQKILATFRSDLTERTGRGGGFDYSPTVTGLAMGGSPNSKGVWKEASTNTDPAVLFIDRCLQFGRSVHLADPLG